MSDKNTPAFPREHPSKDIPGMTLRDYFAAKALTGAFNSRGFVGEFTFEEKAVWVYQMADAMLEVRSA